MTDETTAEYIASRDECAVAEVLRRYESGQLIRDVDRDTDVLIACQDRDELIRDMLLTINWAMHGAKVGCGKYQEYYSRCKELGVELR